MFTLRIFLKGSTSVATKKENLIEEAQKMALRGQFDKAIKLYAQIMKLEPAVINHRQKLAELQAKAGNLKESREEFETIGRHYSSNGFYLKAIAVYKKLQTMFPGDTSITLTLADMNEKHGLIANALAEYKQVYNYYEQNSNHAEALKILEKMHCVDRQNTTICIKLAEAFYEASMKDDSYAAFGRLASLLQEKDESEALEKINHRIKQLFPEKSEFSLEVLASQITDGKAAATISALQSLLRVNPSKKRIWELLIEAYQQMNQPQRVKTAFEHCLNFFPDEISVKKGLLEHLISTHDLAGAMTLLDQYEEHLFAALPADELIAIYRSMELIEPINMRILKGLRRAYESGNDLKSASRIASSISSLCAISRTDVTEVADGQSPSLEPDYWQGVNFDTTPLPDETFVADDGEIAQPETALPTTDADFANPFFMEELEIEIELEDDQNIFGENGYDTNWLDSTDLATSHPKGSSRSVRFGNEMELDDAQSHYDLGIAFREMGLYDEAVNEFRQAAADQSRKLDCLILQSACMRENGNFSTAENMLLALIKPGLDIEDSCSIKYELALNYESLGKVDEAATLLAEINAANPGFRDVHSRLEVSDSYDLDFSDEDLSEFDLR